MTGGGKVLHIRCINVGAAYILQKKFQEASDYFKKARTHAINTFGPSCHFVGRCDYLQAQNHYYQQHWVEARRLFALALNNFAAENASHPGVAATHLKITIIDLKLGVVKDAITRLKKVKLISEANEKAEGDQGAIPRGSCVI